MIQFLAFLAITMVLGGIIILMVLYFRDQTISKALAASEKARLDSQERADRLTEALARKYGVDLILPQRQQVPLEESPGWWDSKPTINPPKQEKTQ